MGGVADPGYTSERARSGTLLTLTIGPWDSAVGTGVEFLTASIPEADPEKLSRIVTGVLPSEGMAAAMEPLMVIRRVEASFGMAVPEAWRNSEESQAMV